MYMLSNIKGSFFKDRLEDYLVHLKLLFNTACSFMLVFELNRYFTNVYRINCSKNKCKVYFPKSSIFRVSVFYLPQVLYFLFPLKKVKKHFTLEL